MKSRTLSIIGGISYLIIFFSAVYANFFVLDSILKDPVLTIENNSIGVRWGIIAFMLTVVFDVVVAWVLYELYEKHFLTKLSTCFRLIHAIIMGMAIFALPTALNLKDANDILAQVNIFNTIWLIGLFFFGIHLILLGRIVKIINVIPYFLIIAGGMYIIDTSAHFLLPNYDSHANIFLILVAVPSVVGEMSFALWMLFKGGKEKA